MWKGHAISTKVLENSLQFTIEKLLQGPVWSNEKKIWQNLLHIVSKYKIIFVPFMLPYIFAGYFWAI